MPKCEQCQKDFQTEEGLAQHNSDKHVIGNLTKHEMKEKKNEEREQEKKQEGAKQRRGKRAKKSAIIIVVLLILAGIGYVVTNLPKETQPPAGSYDLTGFPSSFIHWHADVDVVICGEDRRLPEASIGGLLGTNRLHTHDSATNLNSLPGSDGNGVIHTEGNIRQSPSEHTLEKFMRNIGVKFSETEIMDKKNGDTCPDGSIGSVKVLLNDQPLSNFTTYLPRDKDFIRIEFS